MWMKNIGSSEYRGYDGKVRLEVLPGAAFEVSDPRGQALLADYPGRFEIVGGPASVSGRHGAGGAADSARQGAAGSAPSPLAPKQPGGLFKRPRPRWKS